MATVEAYDRNVRCTCCKEKGHKIENCIRDPNFKTNKKTDVDIERILKLKSFKKLHVDTMVSTTHFLKKSIMVPLKTLDNGTHEEPKNTDHPFMRGIMQFDDYNYRRYNQHILVI